MKIPENLELDGMRKDMWHPGRDMSAIAVRFYEANPKALREQVSMLQPYANDTMDTVTFTLRKGLSIGAIVANVEVEKHFPNAQVIIGTQEAVPIADTRANMREEVIFARVRSGDNEDPLNLTYFGPTVDAPNPEMVVRYYPEGSVLIPRVLHGLLELATPLITHNRQRIIDCI
jgi:hypothetical protein